MQLTVLQYVQSALNEMDSDAVTGIADTIEAQQVADLLGDIYFELMSTRNWPHLKQIIQLDGLADLTKPNYMKLPVGIKEIMKISYNVREVGDTKDKMVPIHYVENEQFLIHTLNPRNSSDAKVKVVSDFSGVKLNVFDERPPTMWTSFDEEHIVFDSYDKDVDTTLQTSKSQVIVYLEPSLNISDATVPDLPSEMVPLLLNELKARAAESFAQKVNTKADAAAVRQRRVMSRKSFRTRGGINFPNYARRSPKVAHKLSNPKFDKND